MSPALDPLDRIIDTNMKRLRHELGLRDHERPRDNAYRMSSCCCLRLGNANNKVSLAGGTRRRAAASRHRYHCPSRGCLFNRSRDCTRFRAPPSFHAGVTITVPKSGAFFL